ncbi:hypothetical protein EES41_39580 (plasmid) [Streptomyces sp. ADI95-16]|nr:hypothetical protein EES41_39580 [Streptomyces sp. ADI95-16]
MRSGQRGGVEGWLVTLGSPTGLSYRHWPFTESASSVGKPETDLKNPADTK